MNEVEINGITYRIGKLSAMEELHCVRRVAPIAASLGISIASLAPGATEDAFLSAIGGPVLEIVAAMKNEDVEYVCNTCLGVVRRQDGDRWASVLVNGRMQYQDIDMTVMIRLAFEVLRGRVGDFFGLGRGAASTS